MAYTTINKSTDFFNTTLRDGAYNNSGTTTDITVGFQPDLVWNKVRDRTGDHDLIDSVRGAGYTIKTNVSNAQAGAANLTSFLSNGFQLTNNNDWSSSNTLVDWSWKAGTTGSGYTTGSGTSKSYSYSVNTTAGFSIIKYTGNGTAGHTIPHHLGATADFVIVKALGNTEGWQIISKALPADKFIQFDTSAALNQSSYNMFNSTRPSSTVVTLGNQNHTNQNGIDYVMYAFAEKTGYSKFGSYEGNGSTDGAFVYLGFKPKFIMIKDSDNTRNWYLTDAVRDPINYVRNTLTPNTNEAEFVNANYNRVDFLSNGFKLKGGASGVGNDTNGSGNTYIYMAFGQSLVGSNNVPCTAR